MAGAAAEQNIKIELRRIRTHRRTTRFILEPLPVGCYLSFVRSLALFVLGVFACSADDGPGLGEPCTLDGGCSEGVCNVSGADVLCVDANGDIDSDGLANNHDFCNQQPGGAFDEDGDRIGDDCDRCPIAKPPASPDADGDDVDHPCDPDPTVAGEKIAIFEGFNGSLPAGWMKTGTWEVLGGEARYTAAEPNLTGKLTAVLPLLSHHVAVLAEYRIDALASGATENFAGVTTIDNRPPPVGTGPVSCGGRRVGTMDTLFLDTDTGVASMPFTNLFDLAGLYRIAHRVDGAQGACALEAGNEQFGVTQATGGEAATEAGMLTRGVNARFQYILVVQRPN